jgi:alpha-D-ribose 1-methylphosphonate 5-triphosphate synthase subunit PhnH
MTASLAPGFADPVISSQRVFRTLADALARPARPLTLASELVPPAPLLPLTAAVLLSLADYEASIYLDAPLAAAGDVASYLRFHTGAAIVTDRQSATFAAIADPAALGAFAAFAQGTADYPDRSSTLILQVERMADTGLLFAGPGIDGSTRFEATPLPASFARELADNRARFPMGVDLIFVAADRIAALPRSVRLVEG